MAQILQRFIVKLNKAEEKSPTNFYTEFLGNHSLTFLSLIIKMLSAKQFVPEKLILASLRYLYHAIKIKPTFKHIQGDLLQILTDLCLPYMQLSKADIALFRDDGEEYVRRQENYYFNSVTQAQDLITLICQKQDQNNQLYLL